MVEELTMRSSQLKGSCTAEEMAVERVRGKSERRMEDEMRESKGFI